MMSKYEKRKKKVVTLGRRRVLDFSDSDDEASQGDELEDSPPQKAVSLGEETDSFWDKLDLFSIQAKPPPPSILQHILHSLERNKADSLDFSARGANHNLIGGHDEGVKERLQRVIAALHKNHSVKKLVLAGIDMQDSFVKEVVIPMLEVNDTLCLLDMEENYLSWQAIKALADASIFGRKSSHLSVLNVSHNRLGHRSGEYLAEIIRKSSRLTSIDVSRTELGDEGAKPVFEAIAQVASKRRTGITRLNMSRCRLTAQSIHSLAPALEQCQTLQELDLSHNSIGDGGAETIAESFETRFMQSMIDTKVPWASCSLNLASNHIKESGIQSLGEMILSSVQYIVKFEGSQPPSVPVQYVNLKGASFRPGSEAAAVLAKVGSGARGMVLVELGQHRRGSSDSSSSSSSDGPSVGSDKDALGLICGDMKEEGMLSDVRGQLLDDLDDGNELYYDCDELLDVSNDAPIGESEILAEFFAVIDNPNSRTTLEIADLVDNVNEILFSYNSSLHDMHRTVEQFPPIVAEVYGRLGRIAELLKTPPDIYSHHHYALPGQKGTLPRLGLRRLKLVDFFVHLIACNIHAVDVRLIELDVVPTIMDLFFDHKWANDLHYRGEALFSLLLQGGCDMLRTQMFETYRFVDRAVAAFVTHEREIADKLACTQGYIGHLRQIMKQIGSYTVFPQVSHALSNPDWIRLSENLLSHLDMMEQPFLGGYKPDRNGSVAMPFPKDEAMECMPRLLRQDSDRHANVPTLEANAVAQLQAEALTPHEQAAEEGAEKMHDAMASLTLDPVPVQSGVFTPSVAVTASPPEKEIVPSPNSPSLPHSETLTPGSLSSSDRSTLSPLVRRNRIVQAQVKADEDGSASSDDDVF